MFKLRLLIADGSKGLQTFVHQLFVNFGFDESLIRMADNPEAALAIARTLKPDFLMTDWFPNETTNGIALHQQLLEINPACKFALLSANIGAEESEAAQNAGALFLQKTPCSAGDLRAVLGKALQQLATSNPGVNSHVKDVTVAAARHLATLTAAAQLPTYNAGDKVYYRGRPDTVKNVILRRGEMVVQLQSAEGMVPATQLSRA
jgi:DNA-binding NarL/FixJ family response regulator